MAYLGSGMEEVEKTVATCNMVCDTMTGNGSLTTMTIGASQEMPGHVNNVSIYFDGVAQRPATDYTLAGKTVTFTTAPENGVKVVCLSYASEYLDVISDATVYGSEILDGAITDAKIASGIASSKLSGALPAIDGSAVTNFSPRAVVKNASDPTISTNHANGVGTVWANTTSGEMYVCTDATAGANVWTNMGSGSGDVQPWIFQGTVSGYSAGSQTSTSNIIDKFSLVSDANATDVGDLTVTRGDTAGQSSETHGYCSGGNPGGVNVIDKFSFTADGNATDVGDLLTGNSYMAGQSSTTHGYVSGGSVPGTGNVNLIEKFTFVSNNNATDVGDMTITRHGLAGQSSETHGYNSGGESGGAKNEIDRFTFASDANAADVGNLTASRGYTTGQSSTTHGYTSGGLPSDNVIDKFAFAASSNATDVGDLTTGRRGIAGQSSTTNGYASGGRGVVDTIDKFSFSTDGNSSDVANLTVARQYASGSQY